MDINNDEDFGHYPYWDIAGDPSWRCLVLTGAGFVAD
jgi:hypothetical protein